MTFVRGGLGAMAAALALAAPAAAGGPQADLSVSILKPQSMHVGRRSVFQVRVTNHGPDPAGNVVIKDHVSKRGRIALARVIGATSVSCTVQQQLARCPVPVIDARDGVTMVVAVRGRRRGRLVDSGHVKSSVPDPRAGNDNAKVSMRVRRAPSPRGLPGCESRRPRSRRTSGPAAPCSSPPTARRGG